MSCSVRMMSTESANSFTLIGEALDGGTMENLSRRLKVKLNYVIDNLFKWHNCMLWLKKYMHNIHRVNVILVDLVMILLIPFPSLIGDK